MVRQRRPRRKAALSLGREQMLIRRRPVFVDMSSAASLALAAAWSGVVSGLVLVMILVRLFN